VKKTVWILILTGSFFSLGADESWLISKDDVLYQRAEELFISAWMAPALDELPLAAGDLRRNLEHVRAHTTDRDLQQRAASLLEALRQDHPLFGFNLTAGLSLQSTTDPDRYHFIQTQDLYASMGDDVAFLDYNSLYQTARTPPFYSPGFILQLLGMSLQVRTNLQSSHSFLLSNQTSFNFPSSFQALTAALPSQAILSYHADPFEFRIGRDGMKLGPGTWGSMTLNSRIPYFDYLKARFFLGSTFSLSLYVINLNPVISAAESVYLQDMYDGVIPNPEVNADTNGKPFIGASKNLILSKLTIAPWPWLSLSITQTNLVGGRDPILADIIPFNIFHNLFAEGVYSCPLSVTATVVPYKGIKLYGEFFLQDVQAGDESDPTVNPGAAGYQAGLVLLSDPFFSLGPGRFRLNAEWSYVDPWVYVRYYSVRQYTSRFVYWDPLAGELWIDYPLGFYLGPDAVDINVSLAYGVPGAWEVELWWNLNGLGNIDIFGWGPDADFSKVGQPGYPLSGAPTPTAQWTNTWRLSAYVQVTPRTKLSVWYMIKYVINRYHVPGDNRFFQAGGVQLDWTLF
jgi:hypothetical protein